MLIFIISKTRHSQVSINKKVDIQTALSLYNVILLAKEKEHITNTQNNMDES